ncbi:MAG TPA: lanthionine synthetase LanC family protein [Puia sp.]|nr:lanthionine synthetase LanC family protein [Puia sp.]
MQNTPNESSIVLSVGVDHTEEDYMRFVMELGVPYTEDGYYYKVFEINGVQGWILHISVIISEIEDLFHILLPELVAENVPFKIPKNKSIANALLGGNFGYNLLGKIVTIYPENEEIALNLAIKLMGLTKDFRGPVILTDNYLGGSLYARYGAFNGIVKKNENGEIEKWYYNSIAELVKDQYTIPFRLPRGISWPFSDIATVITENRNKNLNNKYRPVLILKEDVRGNVLKGVYIRHLVIPAICLIKEGKKNMISDDQGRDIQIRLEWQMELTQKLKGKVRMPEIIDYFCENGSSYLVTEFISNSCSFYDAINCENIKGYDWTSLPVNRKLHLLDLLMQLLDIIYEFHEIGIVHRDITSINFLIKDSTVVVPIDCELAYSIPEQKPFPPFRLGTPGHMSPEQQAIERPTLKEDIYGLGAFLIEFFSSFTPIKFNTEETDQLFNDLNSLIGVESISKMIAATVNGDPTQRPDIKEVRQCIKTYRDSLRNVKDAVVGRTSLVIENRDLVQQTITNFLSSLLQSPLCFADRWYSKSRRQGGLAQSGSKQKEYISYLGLFEGLGGVLYFLAQAKLAGYNLVSFKKSYANSLAYILQNYLEMLPNLDGGLYMGAAGVAISIKKGIDVGLISQESDAAQLIHRCLELPTNSLDIANGIAGIGLAILRCSIGASNELFYGQIANINRILQEQQRKDGAWILPVPGITKHDRDSTIGMSHGVSGIIWYLLECNKTFPNLDLQDMAISGLNWLSLKTNKMDVSYYTRKIPANYKRHFLLNDEITGAIMAFIKAYELLKNESYKKIAENVLEQYPDNIIANSLIQFGGLSGLGEVYLEAFISFKNEKWLQRALNIANIICHAAYRKEGICYWLTEETNVPTADLMNGNTGIAHFLIRCLNPTIIGYRILT